MNKKMAYVTVLSTDKYLIGVLCLNKSLKLVNSKYKLVVLVNENIKKLTKQILKDNDIQIIETETTKIPDWIKEKNKNHNKPRWNYTFDKLKVFELTQFDKIVSLDIDMFVRKNIDELFEKPNMSATIDRHNTVLIKDYYKKITSGMLVIEPKKGIYSKYKEILNNDDIRRKYDEFGDQDIIQICNPNWGDDENLHLPITYNMFFMHIDYYVNKKIYTLDDIKIVHFISGAKPWDYNEFDVKTKYIDFQDERRKKSFEDFKLEEMKEDLEFGNKYKTMVIEEYSKILADCLKDVGKYKNK